MESREAVGVTMMVEQKWASLRASSARRTKRREKITQLRSFPIRDALITSRRVLERHLRFDSRYESLVHSLPFVRVHIRSSSCLRCAVTLHRISLPRQIDIKSKLVQSNLGHDQAISRRSFRIKRFRSK